MKSQDMGKRLALAGMGTAIAVIFITMGYFIESMTLSFTVLASAGVMLPLTKLYYREGIITAVAASVIGFFIANISVLPYVTAASFYVVLTVLLENKGFKKPLGYLIKTAYSILVFFILYWAVSLITVDFDLLPKLADMPPYVLYILLNLVFSLAFLLYDWLLIRGQKYLTELMKRVVKW